MAGTGTLRVNYFSHCRYRLLEEELTKNVGSESVCRLGDVSDDGAQSKSDNDLPTIPSSPSSRPPCHSIRKYLTWNDFSPRIIGSKTALPLQSSWKPCCLSTVLPISHGMRSVASFKASKAKRAKSKTAQSSVDKHKRNSSPSTIGTLKKLQSSTKRRMSEQLSKKKASNASYRKSLDTGDENDSVMQAIAAVIAAANCRDASLSLQSSPNSGLTSPSRMPNKLKAVSRNGRPKIRSSSGKEKVGGRSKIEYEQISDGRSTYTGPVSSPAVDGRLKLSKKLGVLSHPGRRNTLPPISLTDLYKYGVSGKVSYLNEDEDDDEYEDEDFNVPIACNDHGSYSRKVSRSKLDLAPARGELTNELIPSSLLSQSETRLSDEKHTVRSLNGSGQSSGNRLMDYSTVNGVRKRKMDQDNYGKSQADGWHGDDWADLDDNNVNEEPQPSVSCKQFRDNLSHNYAAEARLVDAAPKARALQFLSNAKFHRQTQPPITSHSIVNPRGESPGDEGLSNEPEEDDDHAYEGAAWGSWQQGGTGGAGSGAVRASSGGWKRAPTSAAALVAVPPRGHVVRPPPPPSAQRHFSTNEIIPPTHFAQFLHSLNGGRR